MVMGRTLGKLAVARALGDFEFKDKASPLLKEYVLPPIHPHSPLRHTLSRSAPSLQLLATACISWY